MQTLSNSKMKILDKNGRNVSLPSSGFKGHTFFGLFVSKGAEGHGRASVSALKEPFLKGGQPKADVELVRKWVGLEEKIVHDYKEQKGVSLKHPTPSLKTPEKPFIPSKKPFLRQVPQRVPRADLSAVKNWVGLEEKIVHDYKERKSVPFKHPALLSKTSAKPSLPAFETFSTQTTVSLSSSVPRLKELSRFREKTSRGIGKSLAVFLGVAVCALMLVYVQGISSNREVSRQLVQLQSEKQKLEQAYAGLKTVSAKQTSEIQWMDSQLRNLSGELGVAQAQKNVFKRDLEKKYRGELMRLTIQYEEQLNNLRGAVQTRDAIVNVLKAQTQAFEKLIDPARIAAVSGMAAGFSRPSSSETGASVSQGKILTVNRGQGFLVIDLGSEAGARSGRWIVISRDGMELTTGRIDRVYPSMSAVLVHDAGILSVLQEGDTVSFS